jgi:hypothetical protein
MSTADDLRARARALYHLARETSNGDESLIHVLQGIECEQRAECLDERPPERRIRARGKEETEREDTRPAVALKGALRRTSAL